MRRLMVSVIALLLGCLSASALQAQQVIRYTEASGPHALGFPVPLPVASMQPVDGFRDYENLLARHQQLAADNEFVSAHRVGSSRAGRAIWAYRLRRGGDLTPDGNQRGAMVINGTTHAREWQAPEVVTGLFEALVERANSDPLVGWLLENVDIWLLPVQNPDGFLQTQRYPDQAILGRDPRWPDFWPRDGRMRRKNMRSVDEILETFSDHLRGVDLNRNNPPHWAASAATGGSSNNPNELVYHGTSSASEPEAQALLALAELAGGKGAIRYYVDTHSFTQLYFMPLTNNSARNLQSRAVGEGMQRVLAATGVAYDLVPNSASAPIGSTDELFAWDFEATSFTLEIEPSSQGGQQYGGFGVSHDGFVLPDSEIDRVRNHHVDAFLWAFYRQAGPPWLAEVSVLDDQGRTVHRSHWSGDQDQRSMTIEGAGLQPGRHYQLQLRFSKPMRVMDQTGEIGDLPGGDGQAEPELRLRDDQGQRMLALEQGAWVSSTPSVGYIDTWQGRFSLPEEGEAQLIIGMRDMAGFRLDAGPQQPVRWQGGRWQGYLDADGEASTAGGSDRNHVLNIASAPDLAIKPGIWWDPQHNGEGVELLLVDQEDQRLLGLLWYHFDEQGRPRWWLAAPQPLEAEMQLAFFEFQADGSAQLRAEASLQFDSASQLGLTVDTGDGAQPLYRELQRFDIGEPTQTDPLTGAWFQPEDSGWGLTITDGVDARGAVLYYYDANDQPRWTLALGEAGATALAPLHFQGACLHCEPATPQAWDEAGSIDIQAQGGQLLFSSQLSYPDGGDWLRDSVLLFRLTAD